EAVFVDDLLVGVGGGDRGGAVLAEFVAAVAAEGDGDVARGGADAVDQGGDGGVVGQRALAAPGGEATAPGGGHDRGQGEGLLAGVGHDRGQFGRVVHRHHVRRRAEPVVREAVVAFHVGAQHGVGRRRVRAGGVSCARDDGGD